MIHPAVVASQKHGTILDTSLMVLWLVGLRLGPAAISGHKRTSSYDERHYEWVCRWISAAKQLVTTTSILTEVSNHLIDDKRESPHVDDLLNFMRQAVEASFTVVDCALPGSIAAIGFADTSTAIASAKKYSVATSDLKFVAHLSSQGIPCFNIWWDFPDG